MRKKVITKVVTKQLFKYHFTKINTRKRDLINVKLQFKLS